MEINNKLKINEYVSIAQLKRKLKAYMIEQGNSDLKPSIFAQGLVMCLVMVLEELIADCLKNINKEKSGLYTINQLILSNLFNSSDKYDFTAKYLKKYSSILRYHDSVFFNINKVISNLEDKHGSKLMIEYEAKNIISYIILSLQYEIVELTVSMVKYAGRKTLNINVLEIVCSYLMSNEIYNKIKLKLDSINITSNEDDEVDEEVEEPNELNEPNEPNEPNETNTNKVNPILNVDEYENNSIKEKLKNIKETNSEEKKNKVKKNNDILQENSNESLNNSSSKIIKESKEEDKENKENKENKDKTKKIKSKIK
jgi:hypothetical protein